MPAPRKGQEGTTTHAEGQGRCPPGLDRGQGWEDAREGCTPEDAPIQAAFLNQSC